MINIIDERRLVSLPIAANLLDVTVAEVRDLIADGRLEMKRSPVGTELVPRIQIECIKHGGLDITT